MRIFTPVAVALTVAAVLAIPQLEGYQASAFAEPTAQFTEEAAAGAVETAIRALQYRVGDLETRVARLEREKQGRPSPNPSEN